MREIKFRAWDRSEKRIIYPNTGVVNNCETWEILKLFDVVMQYTGLKDKDGKDIWEGDIIKDEEDVIGDVFFGDGGFRVDYKRRGIYFVSDREQSEIEIIGNIYENPELLEGK